ncbi:YbhB/YbcL family Raf kinase inhibitor-like protein [Gulosibacter molinativorax]|uniref:YbhB/YbcL family Raf kinase inhibitor-like protein n=1 Tax=Gulosibacter molinativorax TaxID=256821 RepID=A0ABT7C3K3_9MICO|nr:YbhB/YbcL family Raf kinase inhibitor-like protein [Gulosibacter molinativorax]MDJ1369834.1 YbhB/YbcL family Raf kinase inhibitor-like protein [Gulosibacter molinativorax]QUY61799.1 Putative kinase inhibitor protein [Gulosibacter molinativorax]
MTQSLHTKPLPTNNPYEQVFEAPTLAVRAATFAEGDVLPLTHVGTSHGGEALSPELSWDAVPGAESYTVTLFDPDAPTMSGFWHWIVYNLPADCTSLAQGVGTGDLADLPQGAALGYNEALGRQYIGAAPPAGHGPHRYFFTVQALNTRLDLPEDLTGARIHFMLRENVIARGHLMATFENVGE